MWFCNMWCHPTIQENVFWCATMWCYYHVGATTCGCYHHPTIYFNSNKQQKHFNKKIHKIFPCATTMRCYMWCHHFRDRSGFWSGHGDCFRPLSKGLVLLPNGGDPNWVFPKIGVPPNHPFLIGFSIINHPFWGIPIFGNTQLPSTTKLLTCASCVIKARNRRSMPAWAAASPQPGSTPERDQDRMDPNVIRCLVLHEVLMDFIWIYIYIYGYTLNNNDII